MHACSEIPCEFGECALKEAMLGCLLGPLTLPLEPLLSWWSSLLSRSKDTFISLGFGVLNMVLFSLHLALKFHYSCNLKNRLLVIKITA